MQRSELDELISNRGGGVIDSLLKPFTAERYEGERHAYSLAPKTFGTPMSFMGPHTNLSKRLDENLKPRPNSLPVNKSDYESMLHDIEYKKAKDNYLKNPTQENRKKQLVNVWRADDKFINEMRHDTEEPMAKIAGKLIEVKEQLEKNNLLSTKHFEGFGKSDPAARLRKAYMNEYKKRIKNTKKEDLYFLPG